MILDSLNQTQLIEVITPAGRERGIVFLNKTFVADRCYDRLEQAIVACRGDLDLGMGVVITPNGDKFQVWIFMPSQMILQTKKVSAIKTSAQKNSTERNIAAWEKTQ